MGHASSSAHAEPSSCPINAPNKNENAPADCPHSEKLSEKNKSQSTTRKRKAGAHTMQKVSGGGGCPYSGRDDKSSSTSKEPDSALSKKYNVYAQEIDPRNQMPVNPNQVPAEDQSVPLSTHRAAAAIPKGGGADGETWQFPSQQMFYNALQRKGKGDDVKEEDMDSVIAVHNSMNDQTWQKVVQWEQMHQEEGDSAGPSLSRFTGKPHDQSPKSWFLTHSPFHSLPEPFDRHDWIVDRNGREVRYVIDYYYVPDGEGNTVLPGGSDSEDSGSTIYVDVRPALDSPTALVDRIKAFFFGLPELEQAPIVHELEGDSAADMPDLHLQNVERLTSDIHTKCGGLRDALRACEAENGAGAEECSRISLGLRLCLAQICCPVQASNFLSAMEAYAESSASNNEEEAELLVNSRHDEMMQCLYGTLPEDGDIDLK